MKATLALSAQQEEALDRIKDFLNHPGQAFFILKGYAGTGKTTLLREIARYLDERQTDFSLLAPTGRAAAVLGAKTGYAARTIHSELYHFKDIDGDADPDKMSTDVGDYGQMRLRFEIRPADEESEKVYIVDEASMLGDELSEGTSFAAFGTGHLLTDFLTLIGKNKAILVGDPCQLPPVGSLESPALTEHFFKRLGKKVQSMELDQILRQKQDSDILKLASQVRRMTAIAYKSKWVKLPARANPQVFIAPFDRMKEAYIRELIENGTGQSIAISQSNKNCHHINLEARKRLFGNPHQAIQPGDLLMVTQNNYLVPLANGDFVEVVHLGPQQYVQGIAFVRITVKAMLSGKTYETLLCLDPLHRGTSNLELEQQRLLMIDFSQRMRKKHIRPKTEAYFSAMQKDPYLNSLRANYGYAVTCHKSQGGEWDKVYFFLNKGMYVMDPPELTRWWYTGITRARQTLYLVSDWWIA